MPENTDIQAFWPVFWEQIKAATKKVFTWLIRYPLALVAAILVIVVGYMLIKSGVDFNLGGIIKMLFGRPKGQGSVVAAGNTVPKDRVDKEGTPIPVGTADDNGFTQWEIKELERTASPFRDTSVLTLKNDDGTKIEVPLPTGVKDTDVEEVIEVKPEVYVVKTNNESAVHASDLLATLPQPKGE